EDGIRDDLVTGVQTCALPIFPPRELELLRAPEVELDVVLDGEAEAAVDLLGHRGDVAEGLTREQLRHRRQALDGPAGRAGPRRLVDQRLPAVDLRDRVRQVVRDGLERAERLVELLPRLR